MDLESIDNIIFDLGGVICNLDYNLTIIEFQKVVKDLDPETFYGKEHQLDFFSKYEIGQISTDELILEFNKYYKVNLPFDEFKRCWNAMVLDLPKTRVELIHKLKSSGKKVFVLSNINDLHEKAVQKKYSDTMCCENRLTELFDTSYYSHRIGLRKPSKEIFELVLAKENLVAKSTLFIDDSLHHVKSAKSLHINAVHLSSQNRLESLSWIYI